MAVIGIGGGGKNIVGHYLQKFPEQKTAGTKKSESEPRLKQPKLLSLLFQVKNSYFLKEN